MPKSHIIPDLGVVTEKDLARYGLPSKYLGKDLTSTKIIDDETSSSEIDSDSEDSASEDDEKEPSPARKDESDLSSDEEESEEDEKDKSERKIAETDDEDSDDDLIMDPASILKTPDMFELDEHEIANAKGEDLGVPIRGELRRQGDFRQDENGDDDIVFPNKIRTYQPLSDRMLQQSLTPRTGQARAHRYMKSLAAGVPKLKNKVKVAEPKTLDKKSSAKTPKSAKKKKNFADIDESNIIKGKRTRAVAHSMFTQRQSKRKNRKLRLDSVLKATVMHTEQTVKRQSQPLLRQSTRSGPKPKVPVPFDKPRKADPPRNDKECEKDPDRKVYWEGKRREVSGLLGNNTATLVPREDVPKHQRILPVMFVYEHKYNDKGEAIAAKARLVVRGNFQRYGVDFFESSASVSDMVMLRMCVMFNIVFENTTTWHWDVSQAFCHSELSETIYCRQPPGFVDKDKPDHVWKLNKSLYGLVQAAHDFQNLIKTTLSEIGLQPMKGDDATYFKREGDEWIIIPTHVDDLFPTSNSMRLVDEAWSCLAKRLTMKDLGPIKNALKTKFDVDKEKGTVKISNGAYARQIIEQFSLGKANPKKTPASAVNPLKPEDWNISEEERESIKDFPFQELQGCLLWLARCSRLDIATAVSMCSRHTLHGSKKLAIAQKRIVRYLKQDPDKGIVWYYPPEKRLKKITENPLSGFCDSDWAADEIDYKSRSGWILKLWGNTVDYTSKMQSSLADSSTAAELNSMLALGKTMIWIQNILRELGMTPKSPPVLHTSRRENDEKEFKGQKPDNLGMEGVAKIFGDNQASIQVSKNGKFSKRSRHFMIHLLKLAEWYKEGFLDFKWVSTTNQPADFLTKCLPEAQFTKWMDFVMGRDPAEGPIEMPDLENQFPLPKARKPSEEDGKKSDVNYALVGLAVRELFPQEENRMAGLEGSNFRR